MSRFDYVKYGVIAEALQDAFKKKFVDMDKTLESIKDSRAKSLAVTKLEEAYMWIGKAIRDQQIASGTSSPLQEDRKNG